MADCVEIPPWVENEDGRGRAEDRLALLVGRSVNAVRYTEIRQDEPGWPARGFDSIDFGIEFDLDDESTWSAIWEQSGHNEKIAVRSEPLVPARLPSQAETSVWDVTGRWTQPAGRLIQNVQTSWQRTEFGPAYRRASNERVATGVSDRCSRGVGTSASSSRSTPRGPSVCRLPVRRPGRSALRSGRDPTVEPLAPAGYQLVTRTRRNRRQSAAIPHAPNPLEQRKHWT